MASCNVQTSPKNCSKASWISEFHSKQTMAGYVNQLYLSLWVTMATSMIDYGIHIPLMGSSFLSQITTSLNKLALMLWSEHYLVPRHGEEPSGVWGEWTIALYPGYEASEQIKET